jgi:hypothetical protein
LNAVVALAGLTAILVMAVLVGVIVSCVVRKARPDLPQILTGLSQIVEATTWLLPWRRRSGSVALVLPATRTAPENSCPPPEPRTVSGTVVTPAPGTLEQNDPAGRLPHQVLPAVLGTSGGDQ